MPEGHVTLDELRLLAAAGGPTSSVHEAIRAVIASSVLRLLRQQSLLRHATDAEAVHQARVATRRLRSDLQTFASLLEPEWREDLRSELKWLAELLGDLRDADVRMERMMVGLAEVRGSAIGGRAIIHRLEAQREGARARMLAGLAEARYATLLGALRSAARAPQLLKPRADHPAREVLPPLAARPWKKLHTAVAKLGENPSDDALHAVRIGAKRSRYAAEAAGPVVGEPARRFAVAVASVQEVLGDYNDSVVARQWLRETSPEIHRGGTLLVRALAEREAARGREALLAWRPAWKDASRKKLRAWMSVG